MAIDLSKYGQPVSPKATGIDLSKYGQPVQLTPEERKKTDGFFTSVYKSIVAPVANILARPVQLGQELTGNKQFEGTFLGLDIEKPENYRDILKDVGRGIQTVALGIGAPGTVGAVKTGLTQGLKQGLKEGAILGLKTSPLFGAGVSLEQGNTNIGTILKDAAEATAFGVPTTAAFGTIAPLAKAGVGKFTKAGLRDELGNIYRTTASKYVKPRAILDQAELVHQTDPISVLQMYGKNVIPEMQNGSALTKEGQAFLKQKIAELGNIKSEALFLSDERVPLQGFKQYANELVDAMKMSESKKNSIRAEVNAIIDELDAGYQGSPKNVNGLELTEIDLIKSEQTALSKAYNNKKPRFEYDSHGVVGKAARDLVELLTDSPEVKELNKLMQSHYDAIDFLQSINGKKVHGGALSKSFLKLGGDVIGATAGQAVGQPLIGAVTGHVISGKIADIVQNKFISNPVKRALINRLKEQAPREVTNVVRSMEAKYGDIFKDIFPGGAVYKKGGSYGGLTQQELEKIAGQSSPSNMETLSTKTNTANAITNTISETIPQNTSKSKGLINKAKEFFNPDLPNKQGGFIRIGKEVVKQIDEPTKAELYDSIKYLKGESSKITEKDWTRLARKFDINENQPVNSIIKRIETILDNTKTKTVLPKSKVNESVSSLNDTTLLKEAKKYKSAEEFVKATLEKNSFVTKKPITVYRGEGRGIGNETLVSGRYYADSEKFASNFGEVTKAEIPAGTKIFDLDTIKSGSKLFNDSTLVNPEKLTNTLLDNGFEYTKNTNSRGTEYVKLRRYARSDTLKNDADIFNRDFKDYGNMVDKFKTKQGFANQVIKDADKAWKEAGYPSNKTGKMNAPSFKMLTKFYDEVKKGRKPSSYRTKEIYDDTLEQIWKEANKPNTQKGSISSEALKIGGLAGAPVALGYAIETKKQFQKAQKSFETPELQNVMEARNKPKETPVTNSVSKEGEKLRKGFAYAESRGNENPYKTVGVTGDLGKYQVKPDTLKAWSKGWLGKEYTPDEFLNDPQAQEAFFNEFEKVVNRLELTPEESAIIWHKGWGVLGTGKGTQAERDAKLRKQIEEIKKQGTAKQYVDTFLVGYNS